MCGRLKAFTGFCRLGVPVHHHCLLTIDLLLQFLWFGRVGLGTCHDILLGWTRNTPTSRSFLSWHLQNFVLPVCQVGCCPPAGVTRVHIELENGATTICWCIWEMKWILGGHQLLLVVTGLKPVTTLASFLACLRQTSWESQVYREFRRWSGPGLRSVRLPWGNGGLCSIMKQSHCMCCIRQRGAHCFRLFRHL